MYRRLLVHRGPAGGRHALGRMGATHRPPTPRCSRAWDDWDKGDYVAALTTYQELLAGAGRRRRARADRAADRRALSHHRAHADGANPVFSPDSRTFSFETGPGVTAGVASGAGRITHVRAAAAAATDVATLDGGDASFCPDGRHVAFLRVPASPELTRRAGGRRRSRRPPPNARRARRPWPASSRATGGSSCVTSARRATKRSIPATC